MIDLDNLDFVVIVLALAATVMSIMAFKWHCGRHNFEPRSDHVWDKDAQVWKAIYVRDVCTKCGAAAERNDLDE